MRLSRKPYQHRSTTFLFVAFAALALVLGTIELMAFLAFLVSKRTREIGIRVALVLSVGTCCSGHERRREIGSRWYHARAGGGNWRDAVIGERLYGVRP